MNSWALFVKMSKISLYFPGENWESRICEELGKRAEKVKRSEGAYPSLMD